MNREITLRVTVPLELGLTTKQVITHMLQFNPCVGVNLITSMCFPREDVGATRESTPVCHNDRMVIWPNGEADRAAEDEG